MRKKRSLSSGIERLDNRVLLAADGWSTEILQPVNDTPGLESAEYRTSLSEELNVWEPIRGSQFKAFGQSISMDYNGFNASLDLRSLGDDWADAEVLGAQSSLGSTLRLLTIDGDTKNERIFCRSPEGVAGLDHVSVVARATDGRLLVASVQVTVNDEIAGELSTDSREFEGRISTSIAFSDSSGQNIPDSFIWRSPTIQA